MQSPRLPWEVIERVIGHSRHHPKLLRSFSLTCRNLLPRSRCVMLAAGVKLRSRDHAFELVDFLRDNPHLKTFITAISVQPADLPPFPLLRTLSRLSEITFTAPLEISSKATTFLHSTHLTSFRLFGSHVQTLRLFNTRFSTPLALAQLLLEFSSIAHLVCEDVQFATEGNQAHLTVAKQHLSKRLHLRSLACTSASQQKDSVHDLLLDPTVKIVSSVESLELRGQTIHPSLRLSEWPGLRSLTLDLPHEAWFMVDAVELLDSVNGLICKDVNLRFSEHLEPRNGIGRYLADSNKYADLEHVLLKFSQVYILWVVQPPGLRATRNSFWTQEFKKQFSMLSRRGVTFTLKSETVFPAGHDASLSPFTISPLDSKWIASGSSDSTIIIWDTRDGNITQQWAFPNYHPVFSLAFSPDSRRLVGGSNSGKTVVWDLSNNASIVATLEGYGGPITGCAWSPDGTVIATMSATSPIQLWDASTFHILVVLPTEGQAELRPSCNPRATFSPDGRWLVFTCSSTGNYSIVNIPQGALSKVVQRTSTPSNALARTMLSNIVPVFDSGSTRLITVRDLHKVEICDIEMDKVVFVSPRDTKINAASFSPDGKLLLLATWSGLYIWDLYSGVEFREFKGHGIECGVRDAHFSPRGKFVASAGNDGRVLLWRMSDGTCMVELLEHGMREGLRIAFSPYGKTLSSASTDGTVIISHLGDIMSSEQDL